MVTTDDAERWSTSRPEEPVLLIGPRRPIVLAPPAPGRTAVAGSRAGQPDLGVMLPYTPLHHLLLGPAGDEPRPARS